MSVIWRSETDFSFPHVGDCVEAARSVFAQLGPGRSEAVYQSAMEVELRARGLHVESHPIVPVLYREHSVGHMVPDLIVERELIVELKAIMRLSNNIRSPEHAQLASYMRRLRKEVGLLINFPATLVCSGIEARVLWQMEETLEDVCSTDDTVALQRACTSGSVKRRLVEERKRPRLTPII